MNNLNLFFSKLLKSFGMNEDGFSARKMTAFVITLLIVYIHYKWLKSCYNNNQFGLLPEVLLIDFTALLSLLGLTTWERVKNMGNNSNNKNSNNNNNNNNNNHRRKPNTKQ